MVKNRLNVDLTTEDPIELIRRIIVLSEANIGYKTWLDDVQREVAEFNKTSCDSLYYYKHKEMDIVRATVCEEVLVESELVDKSMEELDKLYWTINHENASIWYEAMWYDQKLDNLKELKRLKDMNDCD